MRKNVRIFGESLIWYDESGQVHRKNGPAIITKNGSMYWYTHGVPHREDGPAKITLDGIIVWKLVGRLHRENGPTVVSYDGCYWHFADQFATNRDRPNYVKTFVQEACWIGF